MNFPVIIRFLFLLCSPLIYCPGWAQPSLSEELQALNFLVGKWNVQAEMRLAKNGPWERSEARAVIQKAVGETIFEEEYTGTKQGRALIIRTWLGNDNRTKLYQRIGVDSDHGVLIVFEGPLENKVLSLYAGMQLNGTKITHRVQYLLISNDKFVVESSRSTDDGKTWDKTGSLKYIRSP